MNEKVYRTMKKVGAWNIVFGIILIAVGVTVGVMQIVHGAGCYLIRRKLCFKYKGKKRLYT